MAGITDRSRGLRTNVTDAERKLWGRINREQLGVKFRRRHPFAPYIVDFYAPSIALVVEVDGGQHADNEADRQRTAFLEGKGLRVIRFWNNEVLGNIEGVLQVIAETVAALPKTSRPPACGREGKGGRDFFLSLRDDFPVLRKRMNGQPLAWLDSAASAQKPQAVIDAMTHALDDHYANIHRGLYAFSQATTQDFEQARGKIARLVGAGSEAEIVFTRNATEAINLVAQSWGRAFLKPGDEIILTEMEHHANLVPWQILTGQTGVTIRHIPVLDDGSLDLDAYAKLLSPRTRLVACVHISNVLGTVNDVAGICATAKAYNSDIRVLVDGSQGVVHRSVNVRDIGCDFFAFTGHKLYGPTGIGVLWGRYDVLQSMPPWQGGGDMVDTVTLDKATFKDAPARFEAGTPAIAEAIGLGAAVDYVSAVGLPAMEARELELMAYAMPRIGDIKGLRVIGTAPGKAGIISMQADWAHPGDIAMILDQCGVAVRSGHHCCQPLMRRFGVDATVRASLGLYSGENDIDQLVAGLLKARKMLA